MKKDEMFSFFNATGYVFVFALLMKIFEGKYPKQLVKFSYKFMENVEMHTLYCEEMRKRCRQVCVFRRLWKFLVIFQTYEAQAQ